MLVKHGFVALFGVATFMPTLAAADSSSAVFEVAATANTVERATANTTVTERATANTTVTVELTEPPYDAFQSLLDDAAHEAMNAGDYPRAWHFFWRLLQFDPDDTRALREAGRVAQALGAFTYAADALGRVDFLTGSKPDPELHFLRGEALRALGRHDEAEREWDEAESELGAVVLVGSEVLDRRGVLWLARIFAVRGQLGKALALYNSLITDNRRSSDYAEVMILEAEAYILSKNWVGAERLLRGFLDVQPTNERARAILAWVLEVRGEVDEALALRAAFADQWTEHPRKTLEYARTVERGRDYSMALRLYREARWLGLDDVAGDISRMKYRLSPELAGGASLRGDGSGDITGWMAGATLPFGSRRRVAVSAVSESSSNGITGNEKTSSSVSGWGILTSRRGAAVGFGATARQSDRNHGVGASALAFTSPEHRIQLQVRGDYNLPWRESASTIREDGVVDTATAQLFIVPRQRRLLVSLGFQARRLGLAPLPFEPSVRAMQLFGAAGVDYTLISDPTRAARGEVFDGEMLTARSLSSAVVLSYRHYEMSSDNPFGARLVLVDRSSIDESSVTLRRVLDRGGIVATELRGGVGYDWQRDVRLFRAGASLLVSATASSRLTLDYDVASDSGTGLVGRRHAGSVVLHLDL